MYEPPPHAIISLIISNGVQNYLTEPFIMIISYTYEASIKKNNSIMQTYLKNN